MKITEFLLARIAEDEAVARAADVKQGDAAWKVCDVVLSHPRGKRVRSSRDNRPIAYVENVAGDDATDETGILDGEAAAEHIARHDPARVLAECEAKRRIVAEHTGGMAKVQRQRPFGSDRAEEEETHWESHTCVGGARAEDDACLTLRSLATAYANHPDYDQAWRA